MSAETQAVVPSATREDVTLSPAQAQYLAEEASFGSLVRLAFRVSLAAPLLLFAVCAGLTKLVRRVPLIGWLLAIWGVILTIAGVLLGIVAIPLVFLILLPIVMLGRRAKLRRDVESRSGLRQAGTFTVAADVRGSGALVSPYKKFRLSKDELDGLRPALVVDDQTLTFNGALVHAPNAGDLLAAYDELGRQLIGVSPAEAQA